MGRRQERITNNPGSKTPLRMEARLVDHVNPVSRVWKPVGEDATRACHCSIHGVYRAATDSIEF